MVRNIVGAAPAFFALLVLCAHSMAIDNTVELDNSPKMPIPVHQEESSTARQLQKPVLALRLLDDMEDLATWTHTGDGALSLATERCRDGKHSLRLTSPTFPDRAPNVRPNVEPGRPRGVCTAHRMFDHEDWSDYNRVSFWVYPDLPGFQVVSMLFRLFNVGENKSPGADEREGLHYFIVENHKWNHVVVEIAHLGRDQVTDVEIVYRLQGSDPGATTTAVFDVDQLELQKVEPDYVEGWAVWPGRIAFSHTGYPTDARKTALANGLKAKTFELCDAATGNVELTKEIRTEAGSVVLSKDAGPFQVLDFSEVQRPGAYVLKSGDVTTRPFRIGEDVWDRTIWKTINFFYCERCGDNIPGIHGVCHEDWMTTHNGKQLPINGGWHDAGDLSQSAGNTAEGSLAMFRLAERLRESKPELAKRLIDEGRWGLDFLLKTRFGDGFRTNWATMDFWTDNIQGTIDDVVSGAGDDAHCNLLSAAAEAAAFRIYRKDDPKKAAEALRAAEEDWRFAMKKIQSPPDVELASIVAIASVELFQATQKQEYADRAVEMADTVLACQERNQSDWTIPLRGFFYRTPAKNAILHYDHGSHFDKPALSLCRLCEALPKHPNEPKWREAVAMHAQYLVATSAITQPYGMLAAGVYRLDVDGRGSERNERQIKNGVKLAEGIYLKRFPIWFEYCGNDVVLLSQTNALAAAAGLLKDRSMWEAAQLQLQWVVGRNPFSQSLMYGEGYDYQPEYATLVGDMTGAIPVGIKTRNDTEIPYWSTMNCYNHKEVWVHPAARWLAIMEELVRPKP